MTKQHASTCIANRMDRSRDMECSCGALWHNDFFGEPISTYSRSQAIEDGVLIDLMQPETVALVLEAGFRYPVAMTAAAFADAVWPIDDEAGDAWLKSKCQDLQGRLWDVLNMLRFAIRTKASRGSVLYFPVSVMHWPSKRRRNIKLKSVCGPGDDAQPAITIMLPDED